MFKLSYPEVAAWMLAATFEKWAATATVKWKGDVQGLLAVRFFGLVQALLHCLNMVRGVLLQSWDAWIGWAGRQVSIITQQIAAYSQVSIQLNR